MSGIGAPHPGIACEVCWLLQKKNMEKNANGVDRGVAPAQPQATATRTPPATTGAPQSAHATPLTGPRPHTGVPVRHTTQGHIPNDAQEAQAALAGTECMA